MSLLSAKTLSTICIYTYNSAPDIVCTESGLSWVKSADSLLQLMDKQGKVTKTVNIDFKMGGVAAASEGDLLVADQGHRCLKSISGGGAITKFFDTKLPPRGVCSLLSGDVMVSYYEEGRVVRYTNTGKVVMELPKSLFCLPSSLTLNKVNQGIYICDNKMLLAFDKNGKLKYKYTGSDKSGIEPEGVCTDREGHILITDWKNHRVHVLDKDGRFLQYLLFTDEGVVHPYTIDTDSNGCIWIGEWKWIENTSRIKICELN